MDLRQLRYFVRIVELKSFTKAAEQLGIAQPSLGLQIRKLEDELETQLLERHSRGIEPTEAGLLLFEEAQALLERAQRTKQAILDMKGPPRGKVALGMVPTVNALLSAALVTRAAAELPQVSLSIAEQLSMVLIEWIADDRLDMALAYRQPKARGILFEPVLQENLFFIGRSEKMGPADEPITLKEAAAHPLILPSTAHGLRQLLESGAESAGVALQVLTEVQSVPGVRALAQQGVGYTVLPYGAVKREIAAGILTARRIVEPEVAPVLCLMQAERHRPTKAETALRGLIKQLIADELAKADHGWYPPKES
jgi:LysR family nitrogen assimilation transcriptional regulator